ncbi:MAG: DUF3000 domain-containing protein [Micromonosporaceae bacterium]|nr:DUF3000 domain-containing protein [Micromonosporaceae bacterium]
MAPSTVVPDTFARALASLLAVTPRPEITLEELAPPHRLAPFAHAVRTTVTRDDDEAADGRLVLLYDPAGHEAWQGTMRLVGYATAALEPELSGDPLLAEVGWSWLTDALSAAGAAYTALGGTVTQATSTGFGTLAAAQVTSDLEIRVSWTPLRADLSGHLQAWCALLASMAGLPPPGVTALPHRPRTLAGDAPSPA